MESPKRWDLQQFISLLVLICALICSYFFNFFNWALGSIIVNKPSEGDAILAELFQILKDDAVKVVYSICQQIWKSQQWPHDWKTSVFIPVPKKGNAKHVQDTILLHLFHLIARLCSKFFKLGFSGT